MMKIKKENVRKKFWLMVYIKMPMELGMLCTIDGDTFFDHKEHMDERLRCVVLYHKQ